MKLRILLLTAILGLGAAVLSAADGQQVLLVDQGQPRAAVILPQGAGEIEQLAAQELVTYVEKISGARLLILAQGDPLPGRIAARILLGAAAEKTVPESACTLFTIDPSTIDRTTISSSEMSSIT